METNRPTSVFDTPTMGLETKSAVDNPLLFDRLLPSFKKEMEEIISGYKRPEPRSVETFAKRILTAGYTLNQLRSVKEIILDTVDRCPTIADIKSILDAKYPKRQKIDEMNAEINETQRQRERHEILKNQFLEKFGSEMLEKYVKYYVSQVFPRLAGGDLKLIFNSKTISFQLFERIALFDLADSNLDWNRAIVIGKKKQKETELRLT